MLGAIFNGLSGMNAYSKGLQVISNNVANLNSVGFKASTATFSDVYSYGGGGLTFSSPSRETTSGNGVRFSDPQIDFGQGDLRQSEGDLDLAIQGSGFLVMSDGTKTVFTRTGQFKVDDKGFITLQGTDYHLNVLDDKRQATVLNIDDRRTSKPIATTSITFAENVSSTGSEATVSNLAVYDTRGGKHTWTVKLVAAGVTAPGDWTVTVTDETNTVLKTSMLRFIGSVVDPSTAKLNVASAPSGADPLAVELDFSKLTSFSNGTTSTIRAANVNGNAVGALTAVGLDAESGQIQLTYNNGKVEKLGAVALADFRDPQNLIRKGGGVYESRETGQTRLLASGQESIGKLVAKQIEASNVNLSQEFGDLILIQRGFQASSQVVSVANDMIQQLFGIRGQG